MPSLHSNMFILLCFRMHGRQPKNQVHRKKDDGRQLEAEKNQGVDMIRTKRIRGRKKIEAHNDSVGEGETKVEIS